MVSCMFCWATNNIESGTLPKFYCEECKEELYWCLTNPESCVEWRRDNNLIVEDKNNKWVCIDCYQNEL